MSQGPSSSSSASWSKFFHKSSNKHSNHHHGNGNHLSDNPFHRPPSSASTYLSASSDATFRTGKDPLHLGSSGGSSANSFNSKPPSASTYSSSPHMSSHDLDNDEGECPVCLEPLSFSFRLPGEKPHVVPECGHALHEACFSAVYGPLPSRNPAGGVRKTSLGVCGVCRRPMKVSDGDTGKSNKLAALTGMGKPASPSPYPHQGPASKLGPAGNLSSPGTSLRRGRDTPGVFDPSEDDPVEKDHHSSHHGVQTVAPSITVRSEFATIHRSQQTVQPLTCIVIVELPTKRQNVDQADNFRSIMPVGTGMGDEGVYGSMSPQSYQSPQQQQHVTRKPSSLESGAYSNYRDNDTNSNRREPMGSERGGYNPPSYGHQANPSQGTTSSYATAHAGNTNQNNGTSYGANTNSYNTSSSNYNSGLSNTSSNGQGPDTPFHSITEELRTRVVDWKGHPMTGLGPLQMFDILSVRRDVLVREFYVYLFKEAIICVLEEKKKSLGRLLSPTSSADSTSSGFGGSSAGGSSGSSKGILRLKGRIYIRHIKQVHDTSSAGELSLTIDMEDERLESFILVFRDRASLENWKTNINSLVQAFQQSGGGSGSGSLASSGRGGGDTNVGSSNASTIGPGANDGSRMGHGELDEFGTTPLGLNGPGSSSGHSAGVSATLPKGISAKAARMLSGGTSGSDGALSSQADSLLNGANGYGGRGAAGGYGAGNQGYDHRLNRVPSEDQMQYATSMGMGVMESRTITPHVSTSASNSLQPLPHPALDLILVISVPPASINSPAYSTHLSPATAQLKVRVIKNTLDFVLGQLGPRDRLSLVTFEVGVGGRVRKTPFLSANKPMSRKRLENFIDGIHGPEEDRDENPIARKAETDDEFLVRNANEEKTDVVTAVNHGLDVVLQRKGKNGVSGMVLVSDSADSTRRAQMDLVLARAEAANVPIHSFGYGKSHDPASLWLISNHTSGTYTFVKDWYDLRDCLAGCLGGMMSIGLLNMKLHMKIVDANRFRIRKVSGGPTAIVAQDGKDVHVEVGELRFGEKKEMLFELELDNNLDLMRMNNLAVGAPMGGASGEPLQARNGGMMNATDAFVARMGLDISGDSPNLMDGMMDRMIDEVPVFETDGSFFDPITARQVTRLAHPVLLTVTLLPINQRQPQSPTQQPASDATIVRRRMELLASDMVTRALVLVSRKNYSQAQRILAETQRILHTVLQSVSQTLPPPSTRGPGNMARNRKEVMTFSAIRALQAILQDLQMLTDALDENVDTFAHDQRNFGAQQAMILRDQKSWSKRSAVERLFWTVDNSIELVGRSADWVGRD